MVVCEGVHVHENCVSVPGSIKTGTNCTHISSGQFYSVCLKAVRRRLRVMLLSLIGESSMNSYSGLSEFFFQGNI